MGIREILTGRKAVLWTALVLTLNVITGVSAKLAYDLYFHPKWRRPWARTYSPAREQNRNVMKVLGLLEPLADKVVLDVGAGAGFFSFIMAKRVGSGGKVIATDMDYSMVLRMVYEKEKAELDNLEVRWVDAEELGVEPDSVDVIFLYNVRGVTECELDEFRAYFQECFQALRLGGKLLFFNQHLHPRGMIDAYGEPYECSDLPPEPILELLDPYFSCEYEERLSDRPVGKAQPGYLLVLRRRDYPIPVSPLTWPELHSQMTSHATK